MYLLTTEFDRPEVTSVSISSFSVCLKTTQTDVYHKDQCLGFSPVT